MGAYDWIQPGVKVRILRNLPPYAPGDELYVLDGPEGPGIVYVGPDPNNRLNYSIIDVLSIEQV